ncbi:snake venom 5'-nucleotidase-like, partial [Ruditapes philippinarum]|uniref:snake venom 5'-nucleotidase-like n=1 Tax=Ruditapes philippinarum TaxID=129788 RepID=UPI00295A5C0F
MTEKKVTILHFNDVYNIEPQKIEPSGGAARMTHYVKSLKDENPLVLFSGDALNPSLMSIFLKGNQMIPMLNAIQVQCAVYGNHDFDFGVDHLEDFAEQTNFPWLMSNITDRLTFKPLAEGKVKHMLDWHGVKIGLMGLVEEEWIDTLSTIDPEDIIFEDFVEVGNKLAAELREEGADLVIALTHMRWPNDRKLAQCVDGLDIVLGGHDHDFNVEKVNGKYVIKSGTDFRNLSKIVMTKTDDKVDVTVDCVDLDSSIPEDEDLKKEVFKITAEIDKKMDEYLGSMGVSMDGRFASIRTMETNLGNFVTDIILEAVPADICLINSGTFRSDRIHQKGEFRLRDLLTILPLMDPLVVIEISGKDVVKALENSVSQYPKLEGRFPQVAGIKFVFDPSKPPGKRIEAGLVKVQDQFIDLEKKYRLCTKEYIASGKDGYDVFKDCPVVEDAERCPTMSTAVRNHFESVQIVLNQKPCRSGHRQSLVSIARRTLLIKKTVAKFLSKRRSSRSPSPSPPPSPRPLTNIKPDLQPSAESSPKKVVLQEPPEGSPKKKQRTDVTDGPVTNNVSEEIIQISKAQRVMSEPKGNFDGKDKSVTAVSDNGANVNNNEGNVEESSVFRRDSLMTDAEHIARLAKVTEAFRQPGQSKKMS